MPLEGDPPWMLASFGMREAPSTQAVDLALGARVVDAAKRTHLILKGMDLRVRQPCGADIAVLERAGAIIAKIPSMLAAVVHQVEAVGILALDNDHYDQSHSAPELGNLILVSVPVSARSAALRVAESVVHEAMHLQLSAIEERVPLVRSEGLVHSPWRDAARPAGGVLHGLYVFACLRHFFLQISALQNTSTTEIAYALERAAQIEAEIAEVDVHALLKYVTDEGSKLVGMLVPAYVVSMDENGR